MTQRGPTGGGADPHAPAGQVGPPPDRLDQELAADGAATSIARQRIAVGDLGRTARSGVLWTLGGQWSGYLLQTATLIVLARLLSPADFGLLGMALTLTVFTDQFRSVGLSQAVIQKDDLTHVQVNAMFWINTGVGVVLAVVVAGAAPVLAWFYGDSRLVAITLVLASTYVFAGLGVQPSALLARQLSFRALAVRTTVSRAVASLVSLVLALSGAGYWSLVAQQLALVVAMTGLVWVAVRWRPGPPRGLAEAGPLLRFGAAFTLGEFMNTLSRNADNILVGKVFGEVSLGLYTRAYGLLMLPIRQLKTPLGTAVQPMLATVRGEPERYRRLYCGTLSGLSHVGMPLLVMLAIPAPALLEVLLGRAWLDAAPLFQWLAVAGIIQMLSSAAGWLPVTMGRADAYARMSLWAGLATVASFAIGLHWGLVGVAAAYALGQVVMTPALFAYCVQGSPVRMSDVAGAAWRPATVAASVAAGMLGAMWTIDAVEIPYLGAAHALWRLLALEFVGGLTWLLVAGAWPSARTELLGILGRLARRR